MKDEKAIEAARALGIELEVTEQSRSSENLRVTTTRTVRAALPKPTAIRARFVAQGWAELAKKVFVREIEVGEKGFDDAVYVATDTPEPTRSFLDAPRVREVLVALVKRECVIDVRERELVVSHEDAAGSKTSVASEVVALASALVA